MNENQSFTIIFDKGTNYGVCSYLNESSLHWEQEGMHKINTSNKTCLAQHMSVFGIIYYDQPSIQYIVMMLGTKIGGYIALLICCLLLMR